MLRSHKLRDPITTGFTLNKIANKKENKKTRDALKKAIICQSRLIPIAEA
jgi:hypothetical protein